MFVTAALLISVIGWVTGSCTARQPNNSSYLPLQNCLTYYQMTIGVGVPAQQSTFLVDTGSNLLWIPVTSCACNSSYNETQSSTYAPNNKQDQLKYADGSAVSGYEGTQQLSVTNTTINASACPLLFVTDQSTHYTDSNGIVGFGVTNPTFLDRAYQQNQIGTPIFILMLRQVDTQSYMLYNTLPDSIMNNNVYVPVSNSKLWALDCLGFEAGGVDLSSSSQSQMLVDSGTTLLVLNDKLFDNLMSKSLSFCSYNDTIQSYTCPTNYTLPIIYVYARGYLLQIHPNNYAVQSDNNTNTLQITNGDQTILGVVFMQGYNITFDKKKKRVGFDGPGQILQRIGSDFFYYSVIIVMGVIAGCLLTLMILTCVNNQKVRS